jgi:hypothetical protein
MPEHATPALSCTKVGCHVQTSVALIHVRDGVGRCEACHVEGATLTLTCTAAAPCHGSGAFPPTHPAPEPIHLSSDSCTSVCHQTSTGKSDVSKLHVGPDQSKHCSHCHTGSGTAVKTCATCHTPGTYHADAAVRHAVAVPNPCIGSGCHVTDASVIHRKDGQDRCIACHAIGVDASIKGTVCTNCHTGGVSHVSAHDDECNNCHGDSHWEGVPPTIGTGDCQDCHGNPGTIYRHPNVDCHGDCHNWLYDNYAWTLSW